MKTVKLNHEYEESVRKVGKKIRERTDGVFERIHVLPKSVYRRDLYTACIFVSHSVEALLGYTQPFRQQQTGELELSKGIFTRQCKNLNESLELIERQLVEMEDSLKEVN